MTERQAGAVGIAAVAVFWVALLAFGAMRPDYSYFTKAVSELGVIGAPNALAWNLVGFIVPGLLLAISAAGLASAVDGRRGALWWLLVMSGLCFAATGAIPGEMRNGSPVMESSWTQAHLLMATLSPIFWAIAAVMMIRRVKRNPDWKAFLPQAVALAVLCVGGFILSILAPAVLPDLAQRPGLSQRLCFAAYFLWFLLISLRLLSVVPRLRPEAVRDS